MSVELGRQWVAAYPSADSWRNAIAIYRNMMKPDVEGTLDLLRLMRATNALTRLRLQHSMRARRSTRPTSTRPRRCSTQGMAAKQVDAGRAPRFKDGDRRPQVQAEADRRRSRPRRSRPRQSRPRCSASATAITGWANIPRRPTSIARSLAKPGADAGMANLHLGMALARAGDKAGRDGGVERGHRSARRNRQILAAVPAVARLTLLVEGRGGASAACRRPFSLRAIRGLETVPFRDG